MAREEKLNIFRAVTDPPHYENRLTRALLIVLDLSPRAHAAWLKLVAPTHQLDELPEATFRTQHRDLPPGKLLSVFLAPEDPPSGDRTIVASERVQVIDADIDYGGELVVAVETKVDALASDFQSRNLKTGDHVKLVDGQEADSIKWRDLLKAFSDLSEDNLVAGAEAAVLKDFLDYVDTHFPALGSFRTLGACGNYRPRQLRRLAEILGEAVDSEAAEINKDGASLPVSAERVIAARAFLDAPDGGGDIALKLYPADKLDQARVFYNDQTMINGLRELLLQEGWDAKPNFHFAEERTGRYWCGTCNKTDVYEYINFWTERINDCPRASVSPEQWEAGEWGTDWDELETERIACSQDRQTFASKVGKRPVVLPRPGIAVCRRWAFTEVVKLDKGGAFAREVRQAIDAALTACGESPPGSHRQPALAALIALTLTL